MLTMLPCLPMQGGRSTPFSPGLGVTGYPIQPWKGAGVYPSSPGQGYPIQSWIGCAPAHPDLGWVPSIWTWNGVPFTPFGWMGYSPLKCEQAGTCENSTFPRTSYTGGNYERELYPQMSGTLACLRNDCFTK